ncbi:MAG: hypothetical protein Q4G27_05450 [Flavobacteriaceae bacterium]|nr:hypothetical protein [Flavobacteriaceae bacterium]
MILVLTTEAGDLSHSRFIEWLNYYQADYMILTGESIFRNETEIYINKNNHLLVNGRNLSKEVRVILNRRWLTTDELPRIVDDKKFNIGLRKTISSEIYEFRQFLDHSLRNAEWIPKIDKANVNKLTILHKAMSCGLNVPDFIVTNNKNALASFMKRHSKIITKAIGNFPRNFTENNFLINPIYTKVIDTNFINILPIRFQMSIFQELIIKKKEYRILYFNRKCFPVELLTQENEISKIDSRKTDGNEDVFRIIYSELPNEIEERIVKLMETIKLNIGCIDILQSENNEFYFLEVNPVGQISGYSFRGNLDFEKEVVEYMIKRDKNES